MTFRVKVGERTLLISFRFQTFCSVRVAETGEALASGLVRCHPDDEFNKRIGAMKALDDAFRLNFCPNRAERARIWAEFHYRFSGPWEQAKSMVASLESEAPR